MNITVTGYQGFIGKKVFIKLAALGHDVDGVEIGEKVPKSDVIIHCGALLDNSAEMAENNLELTSSVVRKANKVVFTSSAAVYPDKKRKWKETDEPNPITNYGIVKLLEEGIIRRNVKNYSILRLSNVWGYDSDHGVISNIMREKFVMNGDGQQVRDFIFVEDVVNVLIEAALTDKWNGIYNISTGRGITIEEIYKRLGCSDEVKQNKKKVEEIYYSVLSNRKARKKGFKPTIIL